MVSLITIKKRTQVVQFPSVRPNPAPIEVTGNSPIDFGRNRITSIMGYIGPLRSEGKFSRARPPSCRSSEVDSDPGNDRGRCGETGGGHGITTDVWKKTQAWDQEPCKVRLHNRQDPMAVI